MSRLWRGVAAVTVALCLVAAIALGALIWIASSVERGFKQATASYRMEGLSSPANIAKQPRLYFLEGLDFNEGPVRLILESDITGGDALLIEDQDLLRKLADTASIPDLKVSWRDFSLLGVFSERIKRRVPAIRIYVNGNLRDTVYCLPKICSADAETQSSLAPLVDGAAGRVIAHRQRFTDHAAYVAAFTDAKSAPGLLTELSMEPSPASSRPIWAAITLPVTVDDSTGALGSPADGSADIEALIEERAGSNILTSVTATRLTPTTAIYDRCRKNNAPLSVLGKENIVIPEIRIRTDAEGYARLAAITDWSFLTVAPPVPLPQAIEDALASGSLPPECLVTRMPYDQPLLSPVALSPPEPEEYELTWEEVVRMEAH